MSKKKIAIVGATGMVGSKFLEVLKERGLDHNYVLFASARSAGKKIEFFGKQLTVVELNEENIKKAKVKYALFSAGGSISEKFAPIFAENGALVIDNSSHFRMHDTVPLVVPEVNPKAAKKHKGIIANPNCSTIQAVVALAPLHKKFGIKRIVYSTYQAVSGAAVAGYADLQNAYDAYPQEAVPQKFVHPIFNNLIPHIDVFLPSGYTKEEQKMIDETKKILGTQNIAVTATTVRVPVLNCHSESINVEFKKPCTLEEVKACLAEAQGVVLMDDTAQNTYPMPINVDNKDEVFVGRVRLDDTVKSGINMWVVADNIRKGAATNTVQILELFLKK